jgi:DNA-binding beta-propeller fold protein YncE
MPLSILIRLILMLLAATSVVATEASLYAASDSIMLPTGFVITPTSVPQSKLELLNPQLKDFPRFIASGAVATALSPDKRTLLILTSGYNRNYNTCGASIPEDSQQYVFVYDITHNRPERKQVLRIPNSFAGVSFDPGGQKFYVGGGSDDNIHIFQKNRDKVWVEDGHPIRLKNKPGNGYTGSEGKVTGGLAVTADGSKIVVANVFNDSISIVDSETGASVGVDLRPGKAHSAQQGIPGGEYPFWVVIKGSDTAYVSSLRDREIVEVALTGKPAVSARIPIAGTPWKMLLNHAQTLLYVACDNSDTVSIISTRTNQVVRRIWASGIAEFSSNNIATYSGSGPIDLALSPDERTLYVANCGSNSISVINLSRNRPRVVGMLPVTYAPTSVSVSGDGRWLYVANGRSRTGPNPGFFNGHPDVKHSGGNWAKNQFALQLERSGLLSFPIPDRTTLERLTELAVRNDLYTASGRSQDVVVMGELRKRIKHVIYVLKENRGYDQILGDLGRGNGSRALNVFGEKTTPNFHRMAREFVDLDNFYASGDVSGEGWPWSTSGRGTNFVTSTVPICQAYLAGPGVDYDYEGLNRNINVGLGTAKERHAANCKSPTDPDILPGTNDVAAPDGPKGTHAGRGYLWDAALRAGLTLRNYGFFLDLRLQDRHPVHETDPRNACPVAYATKAALIPNTDRYFRGFDNAFPDYYREIEWEREFDKFAKQGNLPSLELVRLMHDHMGNFDTAIDGVNTPELQQADNDYATARLIDKVAHSRFRSNTLIFVVEDDAQDGADHVDAHRTTAYVAGPYVRRGAVVSQFYTTVNLLRTIEDVLGLQHLNLYTATQRPMTEVFDLGKREWTFSAAPARLLYYTRLPLPGREQAQTWIPRPTHDCAYWAAKTAGFDFSQEDNLGDPDKFNRIIWAGLKGNVPYPSETLQVKRFPPTR